MARQYVGTPYLGPDSIWHYPYYDTDTGQTGEDLSYEGPASGATGGTGTTAAAPAPTVPRYPYVGNYPTQYGGGTVAPSTPSTIGAGTVGTQFGYGVPGFGQDLIPIQPSYMDYLANAPGYIPGSGTYNQYRLDQPGLVGTVGGVPNMNLRYGQGGTGDPTTGREVQTPEQIVQGPPLFTSTRTSNWGQGDQAGTGLDYIATLFLRPDTPSGINTAAWSAPEAYWQGLASQIANGQIQPTAAGWAALAQKGYTPQKIGGAAPAQAQSVGGAGGAPGNTEQDALASMAASQAADQAARQAYQEWVIRSGDEKIAMQKAQEAWGRTFNEQQQAWQQKYQTAGLTGQIDGQQTLAAQQQAWNQRYQEQSLGQQGALGLLGVQAGLQGPRDWQKYWQLSASAPQGLQSALSSLAGRYGYAPGAQGTPGPATLESRTQDLLSGGNLGAGAPSTATGTDGQAGNAWQWNLANWQRMSPSMQQGVLGAAEAGGAYGPDIETLLKQAAPRYTAGGAPAALQL
jgi:hypothetical protein